MIRCFALPPVVNGYFSEPSAVAQWCLEHREQPMALNDTQGEALARLVPLLLCGEQSAVLVFNTENARLAERERLSADYLNAIEADERHHEEALQLLCDKLPQAPQLHRIKRRSQRFYTRIAQEAVSVAEHFATIAALDRCVSILMHTVARSSISGSAAAHLFELIKKDEARHVSVAQHHSEYLHRGQGALPQAIDWIEEELVEMLRTQEDAFQALDIDSEQLFSRLRGAGVKRRRGGEQCQYA
ncbi:MAG: hypothetical protein ACPG4U_10595 [Pseudomonadales bacterium]